MKRKIELGRSQSEQRLERTRVNIDEIDYEVLNKGFTKELIETMPDNIVSRIRHSFNISKKLKKNT